MKRAGYICGVVVLVMLLLGRLASAQTGRWINIGPAPIQGPFVFGPASGRIASIAVDPNDSNHWLVGAPDGGVWATVNAGTSWTPLTDDQASLAMGAIAFAPSNPKIIYAGTGDRTQSVGTYFGAGLLKSTDGGATWDLRAASTFARTSFSRILVDPATPDIVLATTGGGSVGLDPTLRPPSVPPRGIFKSTDGGVTWSRKGPQLSVDKNGFLIGDGTDLVANTANFSQMYAGIGVGFVADTSGVYRSTDTGDSWTLISGPWSSLPAGVGRVALAISPSNPNVLYVSIQDAINGVGHDGGLLGLWRTDNAWDVKPTWTTIPTGATDGTLPGFGYCGNRCFDLLDIIVDPTDPNVLYASGVTLWKCTNCGANPIWTDVRDGIHIDQHTAAWAGNRLIVGNDGGVYSTINGGMNWTSHNTNLSITQFNGGCLHPTDANFVIGGSQDNGYEKTTGLIAWQSLPVVGDGGRCAFSASAPNTNWALGFDRTVDGGASFQAVVAGIDFSQAQVPLFFPFAKCPANDDVFITGNSTLWRIDNYFSGKNPSWSANSPLLDEPISALAFAPQDQTCSTYAYGTQFGKHISLTSNGGAKWVDLDVGNAVPNRYVTDLAFDPTNSNILYVTLSGFDEGTMGQPGHVFKTTSALAPSPAWLNVSPAVNIPHNTVVLDPFHPSIVYVGTDVGVWKSTDSGNTWAHMGPETGMPNVAVYDLEINDTTNRLVAFTHGRGAFVLTALASTNSTLTVTKAGTGSGTVTSSPAGISCGATCSAAFTSGTVVTLTAMPTGSATFGGWGGDCATAGTASTCTLTMSSLKSVTATFNAPPPIISPTAAVVLNGSAFRTGQTLTYQATLTPGSTSTQVDIYLGALLPDGKTFLSLVQVSPGVISFALGSSPTPFLANVPLAPLAVPFSFTFTGAEPAGTYFTYAGLVVAGNNPFQPANQLSLGIQAFQFTP